MANTNETTQDAKNENAAGQKGARYLKHGTLVGPCAVKITAAPVLGNFGKMDVALAIEGQRFILSLTPKSPPYEALVAAFGEESKWVGATVQVSDSKMIKQVNVVPIADAKGRPVH